MFKKVFKGFLHFIALVIYRVKKVGEENIPKEGKYILCGNHVHALDAPVIVVTAKRDIRFVAKEELYKNPFIRFIANTFDVIKIKRNTADTDAIKEILKALKSGQIVGIFPEGTRNGMKKNAGLKSGAAYMALKTDTKVIPVGVKGSFKPFTKVVLNYGKPMDFSQYKDRKNDKEIQEKLTQEIMEEVIRLSK